MKEINLYILEKLHINKNTKIDNFPFKNGEKMLCISMQETIDVITIQYFMPFIFNDYDKSNGLLEYKPQNGKGKLLKLENVYLNDNNYYQAKINNHYYAIFLKKEDGIEYIKKFLNNKIDKLELKKYFDKEVHYLIEKNELFFKNNYDDESILKELEKE